MATPANSPWAPAMGASDTPSMPVTSLSISCSSCMQARKPWPNSTGLWGWRPVNPSSIARLLHARGLYFMVHEPRG